MSLLRFTGIFLGALAVGVVCGWATGWLVHDALGDEILAQVDRPAVRFAARLRTPALNTAMRTLTELGGTRWLGSAAVVVGAWAVLRTRDHRHGIYLVLTLAGAAVSNQAVKALVERPRPEAALVEVGGYAFPSGHATLSAAVLGALAYVVVRAGNIHRTALVWSVAGSLAALVGVTRVYLGVHWPTDVIAGAVMGAFWAVATALAVGLAPLRRNPAGRRGGGTVADRHAPPPTG